MWARCALNRHRAAAQLILHTHSLFASVDRIVDAVEDLRTFWRATRRIVNPRANFLPIFNGHTFIAISGIAPKEWVMEQVIEKPLLVWLACTFVYMPEAFVEFLLDICIPIPSTNTVAKSSHKRLLLSIKL